jgi:hypothetical protein
MEADLVYYRRRAAEERSAAALAINEKVRAVHLELAIAYDHRGDRLAVPDDAKLHLVSAA